MNYLRLTAIFTSVILSGCKLVDTYYIAPDNYIREKTLQEVAIGYNMDQVLRAYSSIEIRIAFQKNPSFSVRTMITNGFHKNYETKEIEAENKIKITAYEECDHFNDENWNCGFSKLNKHEIQMEDGELTIFDNKKPVRLITSTKVWGGH